KVVDADLAWCVQIPARIGPQRFDVTVIALGLTTKKLISTSSRGRVKTASGRLRRRQCELIELERLKLGRNQVIIGRDVRQIAESERRSDGKLCRVVQTRIPKSAFAMHFQIGNERVPVRHR